LPGVISAAVDSALPFVSSGWNAFAIVGQTEPPLKDIPISTSQIVSLDYFRTVGIPLLRGRLLGEQDRPDREMAIVVNTGLADRFFPGQDPIGKQIHDVNSIGLKPNIYTIVGIVPTIQHDPPDVEPVPFQVYFLSSQAPYAPRITKDFTLLLRTQGDPHALVGPLREVVSGIDPNLPLTNIDSFDHAIQQAFTSRRLQMTVVSLFSAAALLLAVIGLYGVLSYSVTLRRRELSVRMALGAQRGNILGLVVGKGIKIVGIGLLIGLFAAFLLNHLIEGMLFGISAADPISFGATVLLLGLAAFLACLLSALRATRIDPIKALRE
jgi:putative ABC transport system permease protein